MGAILPISEETIWRLHRLTRGDIWDAGLYKEKESDIIERNPDGRSRVRWHEAAHDPWPCATFVLYVLKSAYRELEDRVGRQPSHFVGRAAPESSSRINVVNPERISENTP